MNKQTQERYSEIYDFHLKKYTRLQIAAKCKCSISAVSRAIKYCRKNVMECSSSEELQEAVESAKSNLRTLHERLEQIQRGIEETTTRERADGTVETITHFKKPLAAELSLFREIRQNEKYLSGLRGLLARVKTGQGEEKQVVIVFKKEFP